MQESQTPIPTVATPVFVGAMLAGGQSSRFGSDKSLASTTGQDGNTQPMGAIVIEALRGAGADPVLVVGGSAGSVLSVPTVQDNRSDLGPLSGLASVLQWAGRGWVLVVPCDLPLLRSSHLEPLVAALADSVRTRTTSTAFVGTRDGEPQPTIGLWPASAGHVLHRAVRSGDRALRKSLDLVEWQGIELADEAFRDADTEEALRMLQSRDL